MVGAGEGRGRGGGGPLPRRWLETPRISVSLIGNRFLAFKTPLDNKFDGQIPVEDRFTPDMLFQLMKDLKVKIGLWIDLTYTQRFYNKQLVEDNDCKYVKLRCKGFHETPPPESVRSFVQICKDYIAKNPLGIIGVHCTHGFNR